MNQTTKPIIFSRKDIADLWERSLPFFEEFGASYSEEDTQNPGFWEDGIPRTHEGLTERECQMCREPFWPDAKQMIGEAEPRLLLVGDGGVYLIPSCRFAKEGLAQLNRTAAVCRTPRSIAEFSNSAVNPRPWR